MEWHSKVPEKFHCFWSEVICITLYCIVNQRNRLSIDKIGITDPQAARRNCVTIHKKQVFEIRKLVHSRFSQLKARERKIASRSQQDSYVADMMIFQRSYLHNNIMGSITRGDSAGTYSIELAPIQELLYPRTFTLRDRFHLKNAWAGRLRGNTAARARPPGGPDTLPPEGIT